MIDRHGWLLSRVHVTQYGFKPASRSTITNVDVCSAESFSCAIHFNLETLLTAYNELNIRFNIFKDYIVIYIRDKNKIY